jgi:hypothetical protein
VVDVPTSINVSGIIPDGVARVGLGLDGYNCTLYVEGAVVLPTSKELPAVTFHWPGMYKACLALDGVHYVEQTGLSIIVAPSGWCVCSEWNFCVRSTPWPHDICFPCRCSF